MLVGGMLIGSWLLLCSVWLLRLLKCDVRLVLCELSIGSMLMLFVMYR